MSVAARATALARDRLLTAADTWERHLIVADLAGAPRQVVDVGGLPGQLRSFLPGASVVAANVTQPADLIVPPDRLPFEDATIEVVTSLDALEHVPPADRAGFVSELIRVTGRRAILCCPLGGDAHDAAELEVQAWFTDLTGAGHEWLVEHIAHGLPRREEIEEYARAAAEAHPEVTWRLAFHGDFRTTNEQFKQIVLARHRPRPGAIARFVKARTTHTPDVTLRDQPGTYANRVFLIADRVASGR